MKYFLLYNSPPNLISSIYCQQRKLKSFIKYEQADRGGLVEHYTGDQRVAGWSLTAGRVTVLCPGARRFIRCLVLVHPRKIHPNMTEKAWTRM